MLRNFAYGGLALAGGAITGIAISSWATPLIPPQIASEVIRVAQPAMTMASTSSRTANEARDCSPWDVSDVAMEAALNEMIRRGWRPPTQAEAIEASFGVPGITPLEPHAFVPVRRPAIASSESVNTTGATEQFPVDQVPLSLESPAPPAPAPIASSPPPPEEVIDTPAPSSN